MKLFIKYSIKVKSVVFFKESDFVKIIEIIFVSGFMIKFIVK